MKLLFLMTMHFIITIVLAGAAIVSFPPGETMFLRRRPPVVSANILAGILFLNVFLVIYQFAAFVGMYGKASLIGVLL